MICIIIIIIITPQIMYKYCIKQHCVVESTAVEIYILNISGTSIRV